MTYTEKVLALVIRRIEKSDGERTIPFVAEVHLLQTKALPHDWRREIEHVKESSPGIPEGVYSHDELMKGFEE
jgi:hypothetical protein